MRSCGQEGSRARRLTAASWTSRRPIMPSSGMVFGRLLDVNFGGCCVTCTQLWRAAFSWYRSEWFSLDEDLRQGCTLSHILFAIFIDGMARVVKNAKTRELLA